MQHAPSGDWKRVDWDALAAWLDRYGCKVAKCETETLPTADAASGNARVKMHRAEPVSQYPLVLDDGY